MRLPPFFLSALLTAVMFPSFADPGKQRVGRYLSELETVDTIFTDALSQETRVSFAAKVVTREDAIRSLLVPRGFTLLRTHPTEQVARFLKQPLPLTMRAFEKQSVR